MSADRTVSRRDFLRLRRTEQGRVLEVSCRAMFMRCADAALVHDPVEQWEPWMGEPPAAIDRPSVDEILSAFEHDLQDAQVLQLLDVEWLANLPDASRVQTTIAAFRARGGRLEQVSGGD